MKRLLYKLMVAVCAVSISFTPILMSQQLAVITTPIQTGFVVITPLQGNGQGLSVSETFGQRVGGSLFQASVLSSPPVTLTELFVNVNPSTATDTGIAIVNPNNGVATVSLSLTNNGGSSIAVRTISIGALQQVSRFATQIFAGVPELTRPFTGLVFISSDFSVGVMGLTFVGASFTSLPVASQLTPSSTVNAATFGTGTVVSTVAVSGPAPVTVVPPATSTNTAIILPTTINQIPSTIIGLPPTIIGTTPPQPISVGVPVITTTGLTPVNGAVTAIAITSTPVSGSIIVNGGQLLPQFATSGGWASQIVIANTSAVDQLVRVDVFNSDGTRPAVSFSSNLTSVLIPAGGVVTFSTAG